ncbi:phosphoenolpyruvate synthase [Candidatus Berkelbacteria bacterium]|nr:phosphoenolpyruvate synthase [Candidatus Berkelbacteria bacterium]
MRWLDELGRHDLEDVGGKAAQLGEVAQAGLAVPPGFVVPARCYRDFLRGHRLERTIATTLAELDATKPRELHAAAARLQALVTSAELDPALATAIREAYEQLVLTSAGRGLVAVRPSTIAGDLPATSFAGQQVSLLGIQGADAVLVAVKRVWASLFTARALYYRRTHRVNEATVATAILVQTLVPARVAGTVATLDPVTRRRDVYAIDAAWGLGEVVTQGLLTPDHYLIEKATGRVVAKAPAPQRWELKPPHRAGESPQHVAVPQDRQAAPKLTETELAELTVATGQIETQFQTPLEIEWAWDDEALRFLDVRPLPSVEKQLTVRTEAAAPSAIQQPPLLRGRGGSVGVASGPVRIIHSPAELDRVAVGDVLVAESITPDFLPVMQRAVALVTDAGGASSHAALVARELGLPMVVGAGTATHVLHEGQTVTVDGANGLVYRGTLATDHQRHAQPDRRPRHLKPAPRTATKLYVTLAAPERAQAAAELGVDGVGLLRAEFMVAQFGEHPQALLASGRHDEYVGRLADHLETFARVFHPHPVIYRASDFKTNEYRALKGGEIYEPREENPMLGFRGTLRYLAEPALFTAELAALMDVRVRRGFENVWLMLPFVRTVEELRRAMELVTASGLVASRDFKLWMMCEVPSNVFLIDSFLACGIQGVSIGTNDLTQLILGVDRDNAKLADSFNERDPAVLTAVSQVIQACRRRHIPVSACGRAAGADPAMTTFLVEQGVTSLSVAPEDVTHVRELIASIEHHQHRATGAVRPESSTSPLRRAGTSEVPVFDAASWRG